MTEKEIMIKYRNEDQGNEAHKVYEALEIKLSVLCLRHKSNLILKYEISELSTATADVHIHWFLINSAIK